ncbi:MAG TPA: hypothetical protein VMU24_08205 [Candidatus Acidoferrales bacterium]|nr:hypothetical protein [Candidatus Acidoferrales bacterium]
MQLISESWNPASISAIAAVGGSLVGALASSVSTWITQQHQNRRDLLARKVLHREQLYSDFISETARAMAHAMQNTFQDPSKLIASYALLSRIRLSSSMHVVDSAEKVINNILNTYSQPNLTPEEFQAWASERNDPLREFGEICRRELESLLSDL